MHPSESITHNPTRSIIKVLFFDILTKAIIAFASMILIRSMPTTEYALYTLAMAIIMIMSEPLNASFNRIYIVGYNSFNLKDFSSSLLGTQLILVLTLTVLCLPFEVASHKIFWPTAAFLAANCVYEFLKTYFQQKLHFTQFSVIETLKNLIFTALLAWVVYINHHSLDTRQILFLQATIMIGLAIFFVPKINMFQIPQINQGIDLVRRIIRSRYKYLIGYFILLTFFLQIDVFMLKLLTTDIALATYGSAARYYGLILLILGSVHTVLLPSIQKTKQTEEWRDIFSKLEIFALVFVAFVIIAMFAAPWFIPWVDRGKYPDAIPIFRILALSTIISMRFSPFVNFLMAREDFKFLFTLIIIAIGISISLNLLAIPLWGTIGTATVTLMTNAVVTFSIYLRSMLLMKPAIKNHGS